MGVGVRHALFPGGTRLDTLAFAGGVLPDATLRGMRMFRAHGGPVVTVAGRDLSSEASAPGRSLPAGSGSPDAVLTRLQRLLSRVGTFTTGTARAFGPPLAPRYGSDLLPLRLRWRSGLRSSSRNLWGNCVGARVETPRGPDSTQRGF